MNIGVLVLLHFHNGVAFSEVLIVLRLILVVQLHGHTGCLEEERMGLLKIKEFVINSNAVYVDYLLPSWAGDDPESDCCGWDRVTCNSTTGHVMELNLNDMRELYDYYFYETWSLNISLFDTFKELRSLNLSSNGIGGWIENEGMYTLHFSVF
ncbi:receptor-like protein 13 isoform X7 [Fagus crenata]